MRALQLRFRKAGASAKAGATDQSGLAAVEFALLLPVMLTLFFGVFEVSLALAARADVINTASTGADLVAQESTVTATDMANVFSAITAIMYPNTYSAKSPMTVTIYSIVDDGAHGTGGKVAWSCQWSNGTAATGPSTVPTDGYGSTGNPTTGGQMIANANLVNGTPTYGGTGSVIIAKVDYNYATPTTQVITGPIKMTSLFYTKPRRVASIPKPSACS